MAKNELTAGEAVVGLLEEKTDYTEGRSHLKVLRVDYDFAVDGGAIGNLNLGTRDHTIPDNGVVVGGMIDVLTTFTSATDAATIAVRVEGADDIVAAIAISDVSNVWDAGRQDVIPTMAGSTGVKTTAARRVRVDIAVEALTAGKMSVFLYYVVSNA